MQDHAMTPHRKRSAAMLMTAAGALAPLGIGLAATPAAHATGGQTATTPVNGPLVTWMPAVGSTPAADYAQNPDGSGLTKLDTTNTCGYPLPSLPRPYTVSYSPDGTRAVVDCDTNTLTVAQADLRRPHTIFTDPGTGGTLAIEHRPVWSPDGRTVYFIRRFTNAGQNEVAWQVNSDGGNPGPVPNVPAGTVVTSVAPNGALLLQGPIGQNGQTTVSMLDPGATTPRPLITAQMNNYAVLSPDGTQIATIQPTAGFGTDVYVYKADGTSPKKVTLSSVGNEGPNALDWSPDGKQIAYVWGVPANPGLTPPRPAVFDLRHVPADGSTGPASIGGVPGGTVVAGWHDGPIPSPPRPVLTRLAGQTRIGTSVAVADAAYNPALPGTTKANVAVISRSDSFADALAGNALAAEKHGPLMLTGTARLDPSVGTELTKILAPGATVYVLGGAQALSPQVEADIRALGLVPHRLSGGDRYTTAVAIANEVSAHPHTILVATGANFPDALAAGAAAATDPNGGVVLLTDDKVIPAATQTYLAGVDPAAAKVYGVGGQAVAALDTTALAGRFTALQGGDRYATDRAVANDTTLFPAPVAAGVATGVNWPDALSGGAFIGALHGPLLLADNGSGGPGTPLDGVDNWLSGHQVTLNLVAVFGGPAVLRDDVVRGFGDMAFGSGNYDQR